MTVSEERQRVRTRRQPAPDAAREVVADAGECDALVTLFGRCTVDYDGRASSTLGPGDRLVVLKPDGTVLVHTDEGQQPVNWQPPGCTHEATVVDGRLHVVSERETPAETIRIDFETVRQVSSFAVDDGADLSLSGTEADLKRRILDEPSLIEDGFRPLATERETPAGAVDVYGEDADGRTVVVELKRRRVGPDAVGQLDRYVGALQRDLHADASIRGILVAPSVTDRARRLLAEKGLEFVSVEPAPDE
ncbi:MAG: endonuclease NucS [Haloarculaceae archaeon]